MVLDATGPTHAALRRSTAVTGPSLRLLPPVTWTDEEADIEAIAFMDDAIQTMHRLIDEETGNRVPSAYVINECGRIARRAALAKAEVLRLRGGNDAA